MRISVVLAAYNGEKYIVSQLRSLAEQTLLPDEVIICDDRSTDRTVSLVNDFIAENRLGWQVYINKENIGYINNFRRALSLCTGEVVFLCDQDDIWEKDKIESVAGVFGSDEDITAVISSFSKIDKNGDTISEVPKKNTANNGLIPFSVTEEKTVVGPQTFLSVNISPGCTEAFSKSAVTRYLEAGSGSMPHDWELGIIASTLGKAVYFDRKLTRYRLHEANTVGLESSSSAVLKMRGNDKKRVEVLCCRIKQAEYIKASGIDGRHFKAFLKYTEGREKAVFGGTMSAAIKNIFLYPGLKGRFNTSFREVIGDIIFAARHKKGVVCDDK